MPSNRSRSGSSARIAARAASPIAALSYVDTGMSLRWPRAACSRSPHPGAWDLTGPEAVTHAQLAAVLSEVLGRPIRYQPAGLPRYWGHAHRTGMPVGVIVAASLLYTLARVGVGSRVSGDIAQVLGRQPHDIRRFAYDYRTTGIR